MGEEADAQDGDHADQLAAHEQRADLGVGDAAVAQPDRPVAHEGARGEEVGRAEAGQPPALEETRRPLPAPRATRVGICADGGSAHAANSRRGRTHQSSFLTVTTRLRTSG